MNVHKLDARRYQAASAAWIAELNMRTAKNIGDAAAIAQATADYERLAAAAAEARAAFEAHQERESERHRRKMARKTG
jgi:hypothetical protein